MSAKCTEAIIRLRYRHLERKPNGSSRLANQRLSVQVEGAKAISRRLRHSFQREQKMQRLRSGNRLVQHRGYSSFYPFGSLDIQALRSMDRARNRNAASRFWFPPDCREAVSFIVGNAPRLLQARSGRRTSGPSRRCSQANTGAKPLLLARTHDQLLDELVSYGLTCGERHPGLGRLELQ